MNFHTVFQRDKRPPSQMYHPMHNSVADYWTEAFQKREMKHEFSDDLIINNIHLIPDPLKKNLADTIANAEVPKKFEKVYHTEKMALNDQKVPLNNMAGNVSKQTATPFSGIGSFFSGVMNVLTSVVFRSRSPNYYDCFDVDGQQGSYNWQSASTDVQDKNGKADDRNGYDAPSNVSSDMNFDSRAAVTSCESKLNQVLHLLSPKETSNPVWVRKRPKRVFVEPGSVSESFEDAYSPEDFGSIPNDSFIEHYSPVQYHFEELCETAAPKTKLDMAPVQENTEIVKDVSNKNDLELKNEIPTLEKDKEQLGKDVTPLENREYKLNKEVLLEEPIMKLDKETTLDSNPSIELEKPSPDLNEQVLSCEDKLSKLKALLLEKRSKCRTKQTVPEIHTTPPKTIPNKRPADKHFKNPNRRCSKRDKQKMKCRIEDDLVFANEINTGTPESIENSPSQHNVNFGDYFDEVSGRFRTASTGSDDSFQIVFNECNGRVRKSSDCDSEDSFIVFEDSPDCYVANDVFDSDSESELSDSGCGITCKLAHSLTRTISNLADDSLYGESEDEVDFASVKCDKNETDFKIEDTSVVGEKNLELDTTAVENSGLLLDDRKKLLKKSQPAKKVHFSTDPPKVHVMRVWAFAAKQARAGHWERYAVDRERFKRRIADVDMALSWVLKPQHRRRIMFQRFMPWWNQLKRKELAEKKEKEEEEKRKLEESKKLAESSLEKELDAINTIKTNNEAESDKVPTTANEIASGKGDITTCIEDSPTSKETQGDAGLKSKINIPNKEEQEKENRNIERLKNDTKEELKIVSDIDALAKKIQDLETEDNNDKIVTY